MVSATDSVTRTGEPLGVAGLRQPAAMVAGERAVPAAAPRVVAGDAAPLLPPDGARVRRGDGAGDRRRVHGVLGGRGCAWLRSPGGPGVSRRPSRRASLL